MTAQKPRARPAPGSRHSGSSRSRFLSHDAASVGIHGLLNSLSMSRPGLDPGAAGGLGGVLGSWRGRTRKANTAARATTPAQTSEPRLRPATKARFAASMIKGDPDAGDVIRRSFRDLVESYVHR